MPLTKATQNVVEGIVSTGSTGVSAGSFIVGQQYKITSLGTTTQSQWNTIAGTTGQTYVVGSLFTAATTGASSGNGAAAVARTLANRFADFVSPLDFGAVGDGSTNDLAAVKLALESGRPVDGNGRTYAISGTIQPSSFKGLQNANFVQIAPTTSGVATLYIFGLSDWFIDNCKFDMGSVINSGAGDDSSKSALRVRHNDGSYCENFSINRVSVTGDGNGSRIQVRQSKRFTITECLVHNCVAGFTPDPTNDIMNGFDISDCANFTISNCNVYDLKCILVGIATNRYTRGFLLTEIRDCTITGCNSTTNDQAFDFSGAVNTSTPAYYQGNRRFTISGCTANSAGTWGFKFANVTHDGLITGCIANNCGSGGFVCSPAADITVLPNADYCTANLDFVGCKVVNVLGNGGAGAGNARGFRTARASIGSAYETYPRGIRFISCEVSDNQAIPTTEIGFLDDVTSVVYPTTDWDKNISNTAIGCSVGQGVTTPFSGISPNICQVTGTATQTITSASYVALNWDQNFIDFAGLHNTSSNNNLIYVKSPGWYRVSAQIEFAANATGKRALRFTKNGNIIDRTTVQLGANSEILTLSTNTVVFLSSGDNIGVWAYQNSGGNLNVNSNESQFMITKIDG